MAFERRGKLRKRYLAVKVIGERDLPPDRVLKAIKEEIKRLYGLHGLAFANLKLISREGNFLIFSCSHDAINVARSAMCFVSKVESTHVIFKNIATSGTIASLRRKLAQLQ